MSDLNRAMLIGRLGRDPELRYMPNGKAVANFSIATTERWRKDGEKHERTEWHNVVAFDRLADIISKHLGKGSLAFIEGKLQTRKWQDKDGKDRYTTEIIASGMQMLGSRPQQERPEQSPSSGSAAADGFDDDIPF